MDDARTNDGLVVIAIDGPAGSGKSTIARRLAIELDLEYLDTGAMYRSVTFSAIAHGIDPEDEDRVAALAQSVEIELESDGTVLVDGIDATVQLRGTAVTRAVSVVASNPAVRRELVSRQREWARRRGGGVLEGRDIGSVVFPDALVKIYLTATPEVRAARRAGEVVDLDYDSVAAEIARRDALDSARQHDPLRRADGAAEIDTTHLSIDEVVDALRERVEAARSARERG